jgi:hypothetical protein
MVEVSGIHVGSRYVEQQDSQFHCWPLSVFLSEYPLCSDLLVGESSFGSASLFQNNNMVSDNHLHHEWQQLAAFTTH